MARGGKGGTIIENNHGYDILQSVVFTNNRGFALGRNENAPSPYVTWLLYEHKDGTRDYDWGHYFGTREAAARDFAERAEEHKRFYGVAERAPGKLRDEPERYRYFSTQRPVDIGTFPKPADNPPVEIFNYDKRVLVEGGSLRAWGELIYAKPLTEKQMADYELKPSRANPDREARPSITARLQEAAKTPKEPDKAKPHKSHGDR